MKLAPEFLCFSPKYGWTTLPGTPSAVETERSSRGQEATEKFRSGTLNGGKPEPISSGKEPPPHGSEIDQM